MTTDAPLCLALRHVPFESLGALASPITDAGYAIDFIDTPIEPVARRGLSERDLLVVLGGPIGAYEDAHYPFLRDELHLIERALAAGTPVLGICLGAQLIARVLGARVYPGPTKEIGFSPLALTEAGRLSALAPLSALPVLHWHGDTFDLPAGATRLASTDLYENQAFGLSERVLALQFHIEVTPRDIEAWLVGHAVELAVAGLDRSKLRADAAAFGGDLVKASVSFMAAWLKPVASSAITAIG